jgi:hypothetical protein
MMAKVNALQQLQSASGKELSALVLPISGHARQMMKRGTYKLSKLLSS